MKLPVQITYRNMQKSEAVDAFVRTKAAGLDKYCPDITGCRVVVEAPHRSHRIGNLYRVRVDVTIPGTEVVAARHPAFHHAHEDVQVPYATRSGRRGGRSWITCASGADRRRLTSGRKRNSCA